MVVRFKDRDGREKTEIVSRGTLCSEPGSIRARLASEGLFIHPAKGRADRIMKRSCHITVKVADR